MMMYPWWKGYAPILIVIAAVSSGLFFAALRGLLEEMREPIMSAGWQRGMLLMVMGLAAESLLCFGLAGMCVWVGW